MKDMARQVLELIRQGSYESEGKLVRFAAEQQAAEAGTRLYRPADFKDATPDSATTGNPIIDVVDGTTQEIARQMAGAKPFALLNFASARNPGGGFLNGAKAQEEDLCRCSGLYPCLLRCMEYYEANRRQDSLLYTDHAIYSPAVPFFRERSSGPLLLEPFFPAVITAPAPNSGPYLRRRDGDTQPLRDAFLRRWRMVLTIAADQGVHRLLLGAWGCGAFGGDPQLAAATARETILAYGGSLNEVVFAIPGKGRQSKENLRVFQDVLQAT